MGYSEDPSMVRVDFFKPSGKWYCTEAVKWTGDYLGGLIHDMFAQSLRDHLKGERLSEMDAVCLEPYHEHAHPIMLKAGAWVTMTKYDAKRVAKELIATALGEAYHGNALYVAKDIPGLAEEERWVILRYLDGTQCGTDHIELQHIAHKITCHC